VKTKLELVLILDLVLETGLKPNPILETELKSLKKKFKNWKRRFESKD
jgi:hypothetical protein